LKEPQIYKKLLTQFIVGIVGSSYGLKGFVKVNSLSGEFEHIRQLENVILRINNTEKVYVVEETMLSASTLLMKLSGIDSPEAAKALAGAEILADRSHAAPLKTGEYYIEDLKGLAVVAVSVANPVSGRDSPELPPGGYPEHGPILGYIADIVEGGGGFLAEVRLPDGRLKFAPFRNEFFGDINLESGTAILLEPWILE
jgi:16S rRNA processing protein RimM